MRENYNRSQLNHFEKLLNELWIGGSECEVKIAKNTYRLVQKKGTVLISTSLALPAVAGCSRAETFS